jgi:hemolysin III
MREPVNAWTHLVGVVLSAVGLVVLLVIAIEHRSVRQIVAYSVFGGSLVLMYGASALYHSLGFSERGLANLRRLDHMMIYVLIAGTYTPIGLVLLRSRLAWGLLVAIWVIAALGILQKVAWMRAPRWLSVAQYLGMGWLGVLVARPLLRVAPAGFFVWLITGGVFYSVGALVYAAKWPRAAPDSAPRVFGFHEIWHLFVLAGSFSHYWAILAYTSNAA